MLCVRTVQDKLSRAHEFMASKPKHAAEELPCRCSVIPGRRQTGPDASAVYTELVWLINQSMRNELGLKSEARKSRLNSENKLWEDCFGEEDAVLASEDETRNLPQEMLHMYACMLKPSLAVQLVPI